MQLSQAAFIEHWLKSARIHERRLHVANRIVYRPRPDLDPQIDRAPQRIIPTRRLGCLGREHDRPLRRGRRIQPHQPSKLSHEIRPRLPRIVHQQHGRHLLHAIFCHAIGNLPPQPGDIRILRGEPS